MTPQFDIPRIMRGDIDAFRRLFKSFYVPLCNFARGYISDNQIAEDVAQESLVKYWLRREEFDNIHKVRAFLYATTRNAILNESKHRRIVERHTPLVMDRFTADHSFSDGTEDSDRMIEMEIYRMLRTEIEALPPRMREIMLLSLAGNTTDEVAGIIGIARETVRTLKKIAYKKLRLQLGSYSWLWNSIK